MPVDIELSPVVISLLAGTVTPLLTGLAVKLRASSGLKAIVGLVFVAIAAGTNFVITSNGSFKIDDLAIIVFTTFVAHVSTYYGVWKPVGSSTDGSPAMTATPDFGFGSVTEGQ